jgi:hypothetical protein
MVDFPVNRFKGSHASGNMVICVVPLTFLMEFRELVTKFFDLHTISLEKLALTLPILAFQTSFELFPPSSLTKVPTMTTIIILSSDDDLPPNIILRKSSSS